MNLKIQIIIALIIIIALLIALNMIRKNKLELKYALSWLVLGIVLLILDIFPVLMQKFSYIMGIELPTNMMFFLGFCFSLIIIFILTISLSRTSSKLKRVAQKVAILEKQIESLYSENDSNKLTMEKLK